MFASIQTDADAVAQIARAIEANGTAEADEYDLRAILEATHGFDGVHGWVQTASAEEFWAAVAANEKTPSQRD